MHLALIALSDSYTDSDSYLDCKSNGYIVLLELSTFQSQIQITILTSRNGIGILIKIGTHICECNLAITWFYPWYLSTNLSIDSRKILLLANLPDGFRQVLIFDILEINACKNRNEQNLGINHSGCVINIR